MLTFCRCECGAVVSVWNESVMEWRISGTKNRNGMQLEWNILTKSTGINNQFMFRFRHNCRVVGNFCGYLFIIYGVKTSQEGDKCQWKAWEDCGRWRNECSERSDPGMKWKVAECSVMEWMNCWQCGVLMRMCERMNWNGVLRHETRNGNEGVNASARSTSNNQYI